MGAVSDVRSLEEVIAAALKSFDYIDVSDAHADAEEYEQIAGRVAAAVREWCLAQQVGWMAPRSKAFLPLSATEDEMAKARLGWVPVYTMGAETR